MKPDEYFTHPIYAVNEFSRQLNEQLATQLKTLLENKHLYQKVAVDPDAIETEIMRHVVGDHQETVRDGILAIRNNRLSLTSGRNPILSAGRGGPEVRVAALMFPNVRLFCSPCKERNVFHPVWYQDAINELHKPNMRENVEIEGDMGTDQLIFLALQCQHCKGIPEGFLIRREGWRLSLDGRSPMEHIELPSYIPKAEAHLFRMR
jgi:hypothetical protein